MTTDRGWFVTCGACGGKGWVRNAAVVRDKTCSACAAFGTEPDDPSFVLDALVSTELGWCGCGSPEEVDRMMLAYLSVREEPNFSGVEDVSEDAEMLLAYIADELGWTEHGGSVRGAWLTDDGRAAVQNLTSAVATDHKGG